MDLKEARYILAIAAHKSIGKAADSLYISQPSLSKYLKNLEKELGSPLFYRKDNAYIPTYLGERYLHYAEQIASCGEQWSREYDDITHREHGRLNIAIPIMLGSVIIQPTLPEFHSRYPYVTVNVMEEVNFVAEATLKNHSIDLTIYNVHEFPTLLDYQILRTEQMVLILSPDHPLAAHAIPKAGFSHPWIDLSLFAQENFILLYPDQNSGGIALKLFEDYHINPPVLLHTRNSEMSIRLALSGMGVAIAPESYYAKITDQSQEPSLCLSVGRQPVETTTIAAYAKKRYLPQHARDYIDIIRKYTRNIP
ncbi:MAG: LysR family transcriptional regulator [Lachnospiraceae bacterium]|nr:LysR family transcriptional regulator [Lachnospiraceae bacterium]